MFLFYNPSIVVSPSFVSKYILILQYILNKLSSAHVCEKQNFALKGFVPLLGACMTFGLWLGSLNYNHRVSDNNNNKYRIFILSESLVEKEDKNKKHFLEPFLDMPY